MSKSDTTKEVLPISKPFVIVMRESKEKLVADVNQMSQDGLPWAVILQILEDVQKNVQTVATQEYDIATKQYADAISKSAETQED